MAFVYEKIPEKENLKIKLKESEEWIIDLQEKHKKLHPYKLEPFFWIDYYRFPEDNMWIRDKNNDISVVRYGFSNLYHNDRGYSGSDTSLMLLFVQCNIIAFEMDECVTNTILIDDIYATEIMKEIDIIKTIKEALAVHTKKNITFRQKVIFV